jgi:hypothetical protein
VVRQRLGRVVLLVDLRHTNVTITVKCQLTIPWTN